MSVAATMTHVPAVRFRGFEGDWEQRKFEEIYRRFSKKNDLTYGEDKIISVANMYYKSNSYISEAEYLLTYNIFELGDIAYEGNRSKDFLYGRFVENTIGNGIVSHVFDVFKPISLQYDLLFWKYAINNERLMRSILSRSTKSSTMMTNLVADDFLQESFAVPSYDEQKRIGELMGDIDNLITLQQQKYEKLQNVKKAMLAQMFPAPGATTPAVRFAGFTDSWRSFELSDIVDVQSGKDYKHLGSGDIPVYGTGGYMLSVNEALSYSNDAIGIGRKGTIDKPQVLKAPFWTVDTLFYAIPKKGYDLNFVFVIFQNIDWRSKDESTGVPSLSKTAINGIEVRVPIYEEQKRISKYFADLDNLISLQRRKLEKLQNIKKACLEGMFV